MKKKLPDFEGNFQGHSLKATAVTIMVSEGLSDFRIMTRSGHSSKAVDAYKRALPQNLLEETEILLSRSPKKKKLIEQESSETKGIQAPLFVNTGIIYGSISIVIDGKK